MTLPWLWEDQIYTLNGARKLIWKHFRRHQAGIAAGKPFAYDGTYSVAAQDFKTLAIIAFTLDEDFRQCMIYLHVSAEYIEKLLTIDEEKLRRYRDLGNINKLTHDYEGNPIPTDVDREQAVKEALEGYTQGWFKGEVVRDGDNVGISYIDNGLQGVWPMIEGIWSALASGDVALAREIAEAPSIEYDMNNYPEAEPWYARVLKHCILGNEAEVESNMRRLRQAKDWPPFKVLGSLCYAIFTGNQQEAQRQLEQYLKWFHKAAKPGWKQMVKDGPKWLLVDEDDMLLSIPGLAMCRFAETRGMSLHVDDQYLPKALLLEPHILDSYAETYIQKALSEYSESDEPQRKSFLSWLFPWRQG